MTIVVISCERGKNQTVYTKQYRLLKKEPFSTITIQPQENPARVLLGLHGNSTEWFRVYKQSTK